jgi:hypothetical protein
MVIVLDRACSSDFCLHHMAVQSFPLWLKVKILKLDPPGGTSHPVLKVSKQRISGCSTEKAPRIHACAMLISIYQQLNSCTSVLKGFPCMTTPASVKLVQRGTFKSPTFLCQAT